MRIVLIFLLICFHITEPALAWPGRVVSVSDGDTISVEPVAGGDIVKVRLHGIDCPERRQASGEAARFFVNERVLFQLVEIDEQPNGRETRNQDKYGRTVAIVYLANGECLQAELLKTGLAWVWPRYCRNCSEWERLQQEAAKAGRGLWAEETPIPPWEWRNRRR